MYHKLLMNLNGQDNQQILTSMLKQSITNHFMDDIFSMLKPQMGGFIEESSVSVSILNHKKLTDSLQIKCGIFYEEKIGGCNCHDDPHSENGYEEYQLLLTSSGISLM